MGVLTPMLQRGENGKAEFVAMLQEQHGFTAADARTILDTYLRLKVAKVDYGIGRIMVKHGAFLDVEPLRNALAWAKEGN